jgi:dihydrodipicolinate synthase/N-acetylneuraminate lyase
MCDVTLADVRPLLQRGVVIPASPLALSSARRLDERRQRALWRYYSGAGAGGIAIGVHTTQFAIRDPQVGLYEPLLALAADECRRLDARRAEPLVRVAGLCGPTPQATREAERARRYGFHAGLLSLGAMANATAAQLLDHCRAVAEVIPLFGFYLQPAVGGRVLDYAFWRDFALIEQVVAIKIAPFSRYQTLDVVRAVAESGRDDIALYTGNDDNIVVDLLTEYRFRVGERTVTRRIVGGLLGHWAVWTHAACALFAACRRAMARTAATPGDPDARNAWRTVADAPAGPDERDWRELLTAAAAVTDMNAAVFDAAHSYAGCIPGIHEVLRRDGLLEQVACLDPLETLSPGQAQEIDRVCRSYPEWTDTTFIRTHLAEWLRD